MRIGVPGWKKFGSRIGDPGWKKFETGIRDKLPGSATLMGGMPQTVLWIQDVYPGSDFSIPDPGLTRSPIPNESLRIMGFAFSLSARKSSSGVQYDIHLAVLDLMVVILLFFNLILPV
jgi:hypothetical protein